MPPIPLFLLHLLLLSTHLPPTHSRPSCRHKSPNFRTTSFTYTHPISSRILAHAHIRPPNIIPLLFSNLISNYTRRSPQSFHLTRFKTAHIALQITSKSPTSTLLFVTNHTTDAFPLSLRRAKFTITILHPSTAASHESAAAYLQIAFSAAPPARPSARNIPLNTYARSLVKTMLENARLVLGPPICTHSVPSVTAFCNNPLNPTFAITNALQLRRPARATLRISHPHLPSARLVSNTLCRATTAGDAKPPPNNANLLLLIFGQFLDHDLILTPSSRHSHRSEPIPLPPNDVRTGAIHFIRSDPLPVSPRDCCTTPYRPSSGEDRQYNLVTSFIDASTVYGSEHERAMALRRFKGGKLLMTRKGHLPRNTKRQLPFKVQNANEVGNELLFAAGDVRANENPILLAFHTLFAREHNRLCDVIKRALRGRGHRAQTDEWIYQQARRVVVAEMQCIVYKEYLPIVLGANALSPYRGYNDSVDASMDIVFTTAAFRWGHTALNDLVGVRVGASSRRRRRRGRKMVWHQLKDVFFNTKAFKQHEIEEWLVGAMHTKARNIDLEHADAVRQFLFSPEEAGILDLPAINIQRGRDHGLPSFVEARRAYGLKPGLQEISKDLRAKLVKLYKSEKNIDTYIGGLAEKRVRNGMLGELFHHVLKDQFERLRDGDRFYFERVKWGKFMSRLRVVKRLKRGNWKLHDVITRNSRLGRAAFRGRRTAMQTRKGK